MNIIENENTKIVKSLYYNYVFDKKNGFFARWGATKDEDPEFSPFGPEIADIEISSANAEDVKNKTDKELITEGTCSGRCGFCYKNNHDSHTVHMSLDTIKQILDKFKGTPICQIAYGITDVFAHPQLFDILWETRNRSIIPNITVNGRNITDEHCKKLSEVCGAIAVSVNKNNKEEAYHTIKRLSQDYNMTQTNIHIVLAEDTIPFIKEIVDDMCNDSRLSKMNALVMLSFKDKANTGCYTSISQHSYNKLVEFIEEKGVRFGFDSCSAPLYSSHIKNKKNEKELGQYAEFCESGLFSIYTNVHGHIFMCSFGEGVDEWKNGINILDHNSILDVWYHPKMKEWRQKLLDNKRNCPIYQIG
jgi:MoaA/NifB/PqqE/SkfB family radical SAM enzyme